MTRQELENAMNLRRIRELLEQVAARLQELVSIAILKQTTKDKEN